MSVKTWLWMILVSLLPITGYAQIQNDAPVQELYVKSGLAKQMEQFPFIIQAAFEPLNFSAISVTVSARSLKSRTSVISLLKY